MKIEQEKQAALFEAILSLKTPEECKNFFEDLCSIKELLDLSGRFEVAKLLYEGHSYSEISGMTGASTATICRVGKCLNYGSDGYKTVLSRASKESLQPQEKEQK